MNHFSNNVNSEQRNQHNLLPDISIKSSQQNPMNSGYLHSEGSRVIFMNGSSKEKVLKSKKSGFHYSQRIGE